MVDSSPNKPSATAKRDTGIARIVFDEQHHDHEACVRQALGEAEQVCKARGARFTPLRRQVLEIIWQHHQPVGAYAIMEILGREDGKVPAPPTVYRALDFLLEHRLVHRLASQNAFIGCTEPGHHGHGHFLICSSCGNTAELSDSSIDDAIDSIASAHGFEASNYNVEISGICSSCRPGHHAPDHQRD